MSNSSFSRTKMSVAPLSMRPCVPSPVPSPVRPAKTTTGGSVVAVVVSVSVAFAGRGGSHCFFALSFSSATFCWFFSS